MEFVDFGSGRIEAAFFKSTMPLLAASRAMFRFCFEQTLFGPILPYFSLVGFPSNNPSLILMENRLCRARSI